MIQPVHNEDQDWTDDLGSRQLVPQVERGLVVKDGPHQGPDEPPRRRITVTRGSDFMGREFPDPLWLVEPFVPAGGLTIVGALPKTGKSYLLLDLALAVMSGGEFLGRPVAEPGDVMVIDAETTPAMLQARINQLAALRPLRPGAMDRLHVVDRTRISVDNDDDHREILEHIAQIEPKLILVDPLRKFHRRGENDPEMASVMARLVEWTFGGAAVVVAHHMNKTELAGRRLGAGLSGHNCVWSSYDSAVFLAREGTQITADFECRYCADQPRMKLRLEIDNMNFPPSAGFKIDRD